VFVEQFQRQVPACGKAVGRDIVATTEVQFHQLHDDASPHAVNSLLILAQVWFDVEAVFGFDFCKDPKFHSKFVRFVWHKLSEPTASFRWKELFIHC